MKNKDLLKQENVQLMQALSEAMKNNDGRLYPVCEWGTAADCR